MKLEKRNPFNIYPVFSELDTLEHDVGALDKEVCPILMTNYMLLA